MHPCTHPCCLSCFVLLTYTHVCSGGSTKTWKRRWVLMNNSCIYYFKTPLDPNPCGIIPLENIVAREVAVDEGSLRYPPIHRARHPFVCVILTVMLLPSTADSSLRAGRCNSAITLK